MRQRLRSNDLIEAAPAVTNNRTPRTPSRRGSPDKVKAFVALEPFRRCWAEAAGLAGSSACIWLFSSTLKNDRLIRRVQIEPHDATLPWGEFWRRLDVCRSSCRTFLSPVEPRWRQPPAAPGGIANRSNRFAGEIYSPYLPQVSGSG